MREAEGFERTVEWAGACVSGMGGVTDDEKRIESGEDVDICGRREHTDGWRWEDEDGRLVHGESSVGVAESLLDDTAKVGRPPCLVFGYLGVLARLLEALQPAIGGCPVCAAA